LERRWAYAKRRKIKAQQEVLTAYRCTLAELLRQRALIAEVFIPPSIGNGIQEARNHIRQIKKTFHDWGVAIEDDLNDEEAPSPQPVVEQTSK
jgi:hypothetical protein